MSIYLSNAELFGKHSFSYISSWASAMVQFSDLPLKQTFWWEKCSHIYLPRD